MKAVFAVEEHLRREFGKKDVIDFWVDKLVERGLGDEEAVTAALDQLSRQGRLIPMARIVSAEKHMCWQGVPQWAGMLLPFECKGCKEYYSRPVEEVEVYYQVTSEWAQAMRSTLGNAPAS